VPRPRFTLSIDPEGKVALRATGDRTASPRPGPELAFEQADDLHPQTDLFLGVDQAGRSILGRLIGTHEDSDDARWGNLRSIGMHLDDEHRAIVTELLALAAWHRSHTHCPRCGSPTATAGLGWWRTCPADGTDHYPRTDPAIIVLLRDDADNALLGRQRTWPPGAFSTLAGFVEPGESAESAVRREVHEEVGLLVAATQYLGSQPWPFPASLMLGFHGRVAGVRPDPVADGEEIAEARWIARDELAGLAETRQVRLPGRLSIAHHLIGRWYGQPMPDLWCRW
jgi:NAD+ diphosphatase